MNEAFKKAVDGFKELGKKSLTYSREGKEWAEENNIDLSVEDNVNDIKHFFSWAINIGKDDKYITNDFLVRKTPSEVHVNSYLIELLKRYEIKRLVVTVEANAYFISTLMALGYKAESITLELTDSWGKGNYWAENNKLVYSHGILMTKD